MYLYNYWDHDELPEPELYTSRGTAINISSTKLTREVVDICHKKGMQVGVWIDSTMASEGREFYERLFNTGVDFFCSDYPDLFRQAISDHYSSYPEAPYGASEHRHRALTHQQSMEPRLSTSLQEDGISYQKLEAVEKDSDYVTESSSNFGSSELVEDPSFRLKKRDSFMEIFA